MSLSVDISSPIQVYALEKNLSPIEENFSSSHVHHKIHLSESVGIVHNKNHDQNLNSVDYKINLENMFFQNFKKKYDIDNKDFNSMSRVEKKFLNI